MDEFAKFQNGDKHKISMNISIKAQGKVTKWFKVSKVR